MPPRTQPTPGQAAASRIRAFRGMVNQGVSSADARRELRRPISELPNQQTTDNRITNQMVDRGMLPQSQREMFPQNSGLKVDVPRTIPSTTLQSDQTIGDVFARRNEMEQEQMGRQQFETGFSNLMGRIQSPLGATPFANPQQFIEQTLLRRPSETETALDQARLDQARNTRQVAGQLEDTRAEAEQRFGLPDLQSNLAETRTRIAERTNTLRQTLRDFETNAERRGVARPFVEAEKQQVQEDAAAELADLAIIESAQLGNLQMAREDIDRAVNARIQAFELENAAIEQEITRLEGIDSREAENRKVQLEVALGERNRLIEQSIADERQKLEFLSEAAANGADQGTLDAIRRAASPSEAGLLAGPFIGRIERVQALEGLRLRQEELNLARDKFESESQTFGSGTITTADGQKAVVSADGTVTPISQIDFNDPEQVDALPVSSITKSVMQGFVKTKDLTPTQREVVASELQQIGFNPNTYVVNKLNSLVETWSQIPESSRGYVEGLKFWESKTNPEVATFESQRQLLTREIARLFDVGVLSDQDVAAYNDAMPSRRDGSIDVVLSKAAGIAGAASGTNPQNAGKRIRLQDGREAIVGADGDTLLDPSTGKPLE